MSHFLLKAKDKPNLELMGGKGFNLCQLTQNGYQVPPFVILSTQAFNYWDKFGSLPNEIEKQIDKFLHEQFGHSFAVRSSMALEDGIEDSFAGMLDTFLELNSSDVYSKVIQCFQSIKSDRFNEYIKNKKINKNDCKMAVVIQRQIVPSFSGVLFTRSPIKHTQFVQIEVVPGLGEQLVSGTSDSDSYYFDRFYQLQHQILRHPINIDQKHLENLLEMSLSAEEQWGRPVDIEWCVENKTNLLWILQIRPITRKFNDLNLYCDTNLAESYPGRVSPFTGSIIPKIYAMVFGETGLLLGGRSEGLNRVADYHKTCVQDINGHLYYHLSSYYNALMVLPGGFKNIENWHKMIGGKPMKGVPIHMKEPGLIEKILILLNIIKTLVFSPLLFSDFYKIKSLNRYRLLHSTSDPIDTMLSVLDQLNGFGLTVVNDLHIMFLLRIVGKENLKTGMDLASIGPLKDLKILVKDLRKNLIFWKWANSLISEKRITYDEFYLKAINLGFDTEVSLIKGYLSHYGERAFDELKFESETFQTNLNLFWKLIYWYGDDRGGNSHKTNSNSVTPDSIMMKLLKRCIANREHSRLIRGQYYHLVRHHFERFIIIQLKKPLFQGLTRLDFFGLTWQDLEIFQKQRNDQDLYNRILLNKNWHTASQTINEFLSVDGEGIDFDDVDINLSNSNSQLVGLGASEGELTGEALVLLSPHEALDVVDLENKILVTPSTDPAWVFLLGRCAGLISERGSLLSHTAIIGRELGIPTIVGVKGATKIISSGQRLKMNGMTGLVEIVP